MEPDLCISILFVAHFISLFRDAQANAAEGKKVPARTKLIVTALAETEDGEGGSAASLGAQLTAGSNVNTNRIIDHVESNIAELASTDAENDGASGTDRDEKGTSLSDGSKRK